VSAGKKYKLEQVKEICLQKSILFLSETYKNERIKDFLISTFKTLGAI